MRVADPGPAGTALAIAVVVKRLVQRSSRPLLSRFVRARSVGSIRPVHARGRWSDVLLGACLAMWLWNCNEGHEVESDSEVEQICDTPTKDCRCDAARVGEACCLGTARGLVCRLASTVNSETYRWGTFYDCGCVLTPDCARYPLLDLCPGAIP